MNELRMQILRNSNVYNSKVTKLNLFVIWIIFLIYAQSIYNCWNENFLFTLSQGCVH